MILIFEQDLTHYRASFYDFLSSYLKKRLIVVTGDGEPGAFHIIEGEEKRYFETLKIKRIWFKNKFYFQFLGKKIRALIENGSVECVIHRGAIRNLSLAREIQYFKSKGVPVVLRGIGYSNSREFSPKSNLIDYYHYKIVGQSSAYLCYTQGSKKVLDRYYDSNKVFVAVNTLNSRLLRSHYDALERVGRDRIKAELGLSRSKYLIHVGRFSKRKKVEKIVEIYSAVKQRDPDVGLILIGDGPDRCKVENIVSTNGIEDVIFTGALSSEDILVSKYIFSSDVFPICGNVGLSINHAFLFGIPVVAHILPHGEKRPRGYVQTPEHEYLVNGHNGVALPTDEVNGYVEAIFTVLNDIRYKANAYKYASDFLTVEVMAQGYADSIRYAIRNFKGVS